ncbi:MAG: hypothetical protein HY360_02720 [Verrucomicrobia bacterium]|nr:hypothetical protein [Verrucomicrobiota bacterium]
MMIRNGFSFFAPFMAALAGIGVVMADDALKKPGAAAADDLNKPILAFPS